MYIYFRVDKKGLKLPKGGNQKPSIEGQTTQWPQETEQKNKQRFTKHNIENSLKTEQHKPY